MVELQKIEHFPGTKCEESETQLAFQLAFGVSLKVDKLHVRACDTIQPTPTSYELITFHGSIQSNSNEL